ncbi:MAG: lysophospholipid acyltransferase family protein [Nocardioidaceae bacterium]
MRDYVYPAVISSAKVWFKAMDFRFVMDGYENIPREGGALIALNHISYVDFIFGGFAAHQRKRYVRFMAKKEMFDTPGLGQFMRSLHHIPVDRADGLDAYYQAVEYLKAGELVGIFPEATISRSLQIKDIKSGAVRIAAEAGVPIIPTIVWGTQRIVTKDHPRDFSRHKTIAIKTGTPFEVTGGDNTDAETAQLRTILEQMLDEVIRAYPAEEQPPGSWWLPEAYGGSAPSPDEAARLDRKELAERLAARRAKAAQKGK